MELDPLTAFYVFGSAIVQDVIATIDTRRTAEGKAGQASIASMAGLVLGAINLYIFVNDVRYLAPEVIGAGIGSYIAVKIDSRRTCVTDVK